MSWFPKILKSLDNSAQIDTLKIFGNIYLLIFCSMKKGIHGAYHKDVTVTCICGATFTVNTTVPGPIKLETCYQCHPAFNKDRVVVRPVKGMMEKYLEKQKRIEAAKNKTA